MNGSLVPANAKKALLILNFLRPLPDLAILAGGTIVTVGLLMALGDATTWLLLVAFLPMLICVLLVLPIPNYHNVLCAIQSMLNFYNGRRNYIWRGWCMHNEFKDNK